MTLFGKFIFWTLFITIAGVSTYYYVAKYSVNALPQEEIPNLVDVQNIEPAKKVPFTEFVKDDKPYECDVETLLRDVVSTGTLFISHGQIFVRFSRDSIGNYNESNMIIKNGVTYAWYSASTTGARIKKSIQTSSTTDLTATTTPPFGVEQIGDYTCKSWVPDENKFKVPSNVRFS